MLLARIRDTYAWGMPRWPDQGVPTPRQAARLQARWSARVVRRRGFGKLDRIGGADVGVRGGRARAAVCVLSFPELELIEHATAELPLVFPYVPGLLGFREVPALQAALEKIEGVPDCLLVDGHGLAHPRRFGVACHLGVVTGLATIGCGKSLLVGEHGQPAHRRGSGRQLVHQGEVIGRALRTRDGTRPIYVSIGHKIDLDSAVRIVLRCAPRFRLPEPIRIADRMAGLARARSSSGSRV
jgi:deoxyribonuclease V